MVTTNSDIETRIDQLDPPEEILRLELRAGLGESRGGERDQLFGIDVKNSVTSARIASPLMMHDEQAALGWSQRYSARRRP